MGVAAGGKSFFFKFPISLHHQYSSFFLPCGNFFPFLYLALVTVFAIAGVLAADKLEASYPAKNNRPISPPSSSITTTSPVIAKERQREESAQNRPRLFGISVVEREKPMEATK